MTQRFLEKNKPHKASQKGKGHEEFGMFYKWLCSTSGKRIIVNIASYIGANPKVP